MSTSQNVAKNACLATGITPAEVLHEKLRDARATAKLLMESCGGIGYTAEDSVIDDPELLFEGLEILARDLFSYLDTLSAAVKDGHVKSGGAR